MATKTFEERKEALTRRTLGKRAKITLCVHGINLKFCELCAKKPSKSAKKAAEKAAEKAAAAAEVKPDASAE